MNKTVGIKEKIKENIKVWLAFILGTSMLQIINYAVKNYAEINQQNQPPRDLIPGILGLTYTENPGIAFGFMFGDPDVFRILASVLVIILLLSLVWIYKRLPLTKKAWFLRIPLILIFAGGLGNLIDRLMRGAVRDMLRFLFVDFAIFNVADIYITVGAFAFFIFSLTIAKEIPIP